MKITSFFLALTIVALSLFSCSKEKPSNTPTAPNGVEEAPDFCAYITQRNITGRNISYVKITVKDYGEITVLLDATTAPLTVANFKKLVGEGFYNGLTFHRARK